MYETYDCRQTLINAISVAFVNFSQNAKTIFSPRSNGIYKLMEEKNEIRLYFYDTSIHQIKQKQLPFILTETIIETMLFNMPSISTGSPSLKQTSQTPMILCKSSSIPLLDFSSEISAPKLLKYRRNSCA